MLSIFLLGIYLHIQGLATIGEIVTFMNFAALLIIRLEQVVGFANRVLMDAPRLREFFEVLDTVPAVRDRARRGRSGPRARPDRVRRRVVLL